MRLCTTLLTFLALTLVACACTAPVAPPSSATALPTPSPTAMPATLAPTAVPTRSPTLVPTITPTSSATPAPSATPTLSSTPTLTLTPLPSATRTLPAPSATPTPASPRRIQFQPGSASARLQGSLAANGMDVYALRASAQQSMTVRVSSSQAQMLLAIAGADGVVLKSMGAGSAAWVGILPSTQDYFLRITTANGAAAAYTLEVTIPPLAPPSSAPAQRIQFQPGSTFATLQGVLAAQEIDRYVLRALAGQTMTVRARAAGVNLLLQISGADGDVLKSFGAGSAEWSGRLRTTQDYIIALSTENGTPANYTLEVSIPAPAH